LAGAWWTNDGHHADATVEGATNAMSDGWYAEGPAPKEPHRLGDALSDVARRLGLPDPATVETVARVWPGVVGDAIAGHSRPRSLRDGVLTIAVDSATWATQLRYLESDIVHRLAAHAVATPVTALRVVVDPGR
jgi:predicted nucleic acid-binding Zn ribbon protein